ncbi:hypothetical protein ACFV3E_36575 [Streptomyces sp. NPDC059718]
MLHSAQPAAASPLPTMSPERHPTAATTRPTVKPPSENPTVLKANLTSAESELAERREDRRKVAAFINNPVYDLAARQALAEDLGMPGPRIPAASSSGLVTAAGEAS